MTTRGAGSQDKGQKHGKSSTARELIQQHPIDQSISKDQAQHQYVGEGNTTTSSNGKSYKCRLCVIRKGSTMGTSNITPVVEKLMSGR